MRAFSEGTIIKRIEQSPVDFGFLSVSLMSCTSEGLAMPLSRDEGGVWQVGKRFRKQGPKAQRRTWVFLSAFAAC
jgi:hypothetical protein